MWQDVTDQYLSLPATQSIHPPLSTPSSLNLWSSSEIITENGQKNQKITKVLKQKVRARHIRSGKDLVTV